MDINGQDLEDIAVQAGYTQDASFRRKHLGKHDWESNFTDIFTKLKRECGEVRFADCWHDNPHDQIALAVGTFPDLGFFERYDVTTKQGIYLVTIRQSYFPKPPIVRYVVNGIECLVPFVVTETIEAMMGLLSAMGSAGGVAFRLSTLYKNPVATREAALEQLKEEVYGNETRYQRRTG